MSSVHTRESLTALLGCSRKLTVVLMKLEDREKYK